ncbi:MAG: NUDIX hydrolase [Polyangiaceae bacterium]
MKPWKVLHSRELVNRRWLCLQEQRVQLSNGTVIDEFHRFVTPNWVAVIALTPARELVMVEQYRHGLGRRSRELPAGVIDPGETPEQAARRELLEETGYDCTALVPLLEVSPEPHRSTCRAYFFVARDVRFSGQAHPEPSEVIEVLRIPVDDALVQAAAGTIDHAAHVGALLAAERRRMLD